MSFHIPTIEEIKRAREVFEANEPRDLFYRVAIELVDLAIRKETSLSVAEALAVLLQTWNKAFYRYNKFDSKHFSNIENLLNCNMSALLSFRHRSLESFCDEDEPVVKRIFEDFEGILGPVGAAKCLHLLAPRFFPLWDRAIARAYGFTLKQRGSNGKSWCDFIRIAKEQCKGFGMEHSNRQNALKALD